MAKLQDLVVWMNGLRVGVWTHPHRGAPTFQYDSNWIVSEAGRALSLSLPFMPGNTPHCGEVVTWFFDNLLPDSAGIREWRKRASLHKEEQMQVQTWSLLQELGFQPDPGELSGMIPCLAYEFGNLKLTASAIVSRRFEDVVLLSGIIRTPRELGMIEYEMPRVLTSRHLGLALIAYCLDNVAGRGGFRPATPTPWLDEGRTYRDILPWVRAEAEARAEYESRPRCSVSRDWLRLGIKKLALQILEMPDDASVGITFDGQHLGFNLGGEVTLLPATGNPWAVVTCIPVQGLRRLPRRLMNDPVIVEVRPDGFLLDRTFFRTASQSPVSDGVINAPL